MKTEGVEEFDRWKLRTGIGSVTAARDTLQRSFVWFGEEQEYFFVRGNRSCCSAEEDGLMTYCDEVIDK